MVLFVSHRQGLIGILVFVLYWRGSESPCELWLTLRAHSRSHTHKQKHCILNIKQLIGAHVLFCVENVILGMKVTAKHS